MPGDRRRDSRARAAVLPALCQPGGSTQRWADGDSVHIVTFGTPPRPQINSPAVPGGLSRSQTGVSLVHPTQGQRTQVLLSSGQRGDCEQRKAV